MTTITGLEFAFLLSLGATLSHKNKCIGMTREIGLKTPVYAMK